jgi:hypothetical protein
MMKIILALFFILLGLDSLGAGQEGTWITNSPTNSSNSTVSGTILTVTPSPMYITISCNSGTVQISESDGSVKFTGGCKPDKGARAFWKAIREAFGVDCPKN